MLEIQLIASGGSQGTICVKTADIESILNVFKIEEPRWQMCDNQDLLQISQTMDWYGIERDSECLKSGFLKR